MDSASFLKFRGSEKLQNLRNLQRNLQNPTDSDEDFDGSMTRVSVCRGSLD